MCRHGALLMQNTLYKNKGFTLIELMISIVLGLLISAAAVQLYFTGQMSFLMQKGISDVQDNANFGLRYITKEIRKINYGQTNAINDRSLNGGLVVTTPNSPVFPSVPSLVYTADTIPVNLPRTIPDTLELPNSKTGMPSNVQILTTLENTTSASDALSDQLVIQYFADRKGHDCEGYEYESGRYIIQRFFLRKDQNQKTQSGLVLACEAGSYTQESETILKNDNSTTVFGTSDGVVLMFNVDHFHYLLGVSNDANSADKRYMNIQTYRALNEYPRPRINSIQLGMLVHSSENIGQSAAVTDEQVFEVLDHKVKLKTDPRVKNPKHIRQVLSQTVAIRNGLVTHDTAEGI